MYRGREINTVYDACNTVAQIKNDYPILRSVYGKVLHRAGDHRFNNISVLTELKKRGCETGKLRFKSGCWYRGLDYGQSGFKFNRAAELELSKIGVVSLKLHRELPGKIEGVQMVESKIDECYTVFQISILGTVIKTKSNRAIGVGVGIKTFCYDSDRNHFENPKYLARPLKKVKHLQRSVSTKLHVDKRKVTRNYIQNKKKLARLHEYIASQRNDRNHQISKHYVNNDMITVENLDILGMLRTNDYKNSKLSVKARKTLKRSITDGGLRGFFGELVYKAESARRHLIRADPRNTTRKCSVCGNVVRKDLGVEYTSVCILMFGWVGISTQALNYLGCWCGSPVRRCGTCRFACGTDSQYNRRVGCKLSAVKQEALSFRVG